ncbi:hypothetical protein CspeluHIS016_0300620 [Cutaneotrichosporon spelunceum]|uniref:Mid2 domain-containing protein n=1 Tax=Cutaneotrichosporon spelunceum TaxID=1672016 RepID=A0AAD3TSU1_9TREE|nr:hypothetical protein CspeluHIS016_0300620 [Cutaneotrichosporon spelunceum]
MTADMVSIAARSRRRRQHLRHRRQAPLHTGSLLPLGHSAPYTELRRLESSAGTSLSPSPSNNDASIPAKNDTPARSVPLQSVTDIHPIGVPSPGVTHNPIPNVTDITPSPSAAAQVNEATDDAHKQTARQTQEGTDGAIPTPPKNQDSSGAPSGDTAPAPSPIPTTTPEVGPPASSRTPDPAPSTNPAPKWTPSSEPAPPAQTPSNDSFAFQTQEVWQPSPGPPTTQEWATGPTQQTLSQPSQAPDIDASAEPTRPADTPDNPTNTGVIAGIIGTVSSSSSALASSSTVAVAGMASSPSTARAGTTLPPKVQPTSPSVTASGSRSTSSSATASNSAQAASAGSENESLSTGEKVGIAIGVIAAVGVALFVIMFCIRRRKRSNIISNPAGSNPYAFSSYGAAVEKGGASDLRRKGTQHSVLDFSDGPLPNQRTRWRRLSTLAVPFAAKETRSRGSVAGPGLAGVGSNPTGRDSTNPSFDQTVGTYPYALSESGDDHNKVMPVDDDASRFRNTHYEEWLTYDNAGLFNSPAASPPGPAHPTDPTSPIPQVRQPQARRVPVPPLDVDPFADPPMPPTRPAPSRTRTLNNMYGVYTEEEPVVQHLPYRVTPPPVQAQFAQPQCAMVGHAV